MINFKILMMLFVGTVLMGCSDFLDEKSDKKLAVPTTIQDLEALLNYAAQMNFGGGAILSEVASDNLTLTDDIWSAVTREEDRAIHIWQFIPLNISYWATPYQRVLNANVVLENVDDINEYDESRRNRVKGMALFYRALSFFDLLQIFSSSFDPETTTNVPGIPLRLSGDVDEKLHRNTQYECLKQIEDDLLNAQMLLGKWTPSHPTQPSGAAVCALLSKYYLMKKDYEKSLQFAELCLEIKNDLLDYNTFEEGRYPFEKYNEEVLFYITADGATMMSESRARVSPLLYEMYTGDDRRKQLFFSKNADGYYVFTGDYSRNNTDAKFCGLTTAEVWLTKAECNIRLDKKEDAIEDMHYFLQHRYLTINHHLEDMDKENLLQFVLKERRKELVFRGVRWFDLRRLSREELSLESITRTLNGQEYSISLAELKSFRFSIPQAVIDITNMEP